MNGYDFDKTIYDGDSFTHFYLFCLLHFPYLVLLIPVQALYILCWGWTRHRLKQCFAIYLPFVPNKPKQIEKFWQKNAKRIKQWYLRQKQPTDVVISASPEFLLKPICTRLGIQTLIATQMNLNDGRIQGKNCYGEQKVHALKEMLGNIQFEAFYSDSPSDFPLMQLSKQAFFVLGEDLVNYKEICK